MSRGPEQMARLAKRSLYVVTLDVPTEHDADFNRWLDTEHIPGFLSCPGFISCTRFRAADVPKPVAGSPACRYLNLYEIESPQALLSPQYLALTSAPTPWTLRMRGHYQLGIRQAYTQIE